MRKAKSRFASVYLDCFGVSQCGAIMVIGGNDGKVQKRVEYLSLNDMEWHKCNSLATKRQNLAATVGPDNCVYAIGGHDGL